MIRICLVLAIFACLVVPVGAQGPATGPSPDVPELAPLSGFVGKWESRLEEKPIAGVNEGGSRKGTVSAEWIHGGRFLRQTWAVETEGAQPAMSGSAIMTYDPEKKAYRSWTFVSTGMTSESEGTYDAKSKTLTWTARGANGVRTVTKSSFPEDGAETWSITVKDGDGRVVVDITGKNTRLKK